MVTSRRRFGVPRSILLVAALASTAALGGCRKSGSGSGSLSVQNGHGSVLVLLTDSTTGEFEHVSIDISKVSLIPEGEGDPVVVFEGTQRVDLLRFRNSDFLLASNSEVPEGQYQKTRLEFSGVKLVPNPDGLEVALPSGRIDLNSQVAFQVSQETPLFVKIDIDADQSITFHESVFGGNPRWVFHPVVFIDIGAGGTQDNCFPEVAGTIASIHLPERGEDPAQLVLDLGPDRGTVRVEVGPGRAVYGPDARRTELSALEVGGPVLLRGNLRGDALLEAVWVMAGEPLDAGGTFHGTFAGGRFGLQVEGVDRRLDGETTPDTLVFAECGEDPLPLSLASGRQARVVGAELEGNILRAAVIELSPTRIRGEIASLDQSRQEMTLRIDPGAEARLRFNAQTVVSLVGDGNLGLGDLATGQTVTATVEAGDDLALRIEVEPMRVEGEAWELDIRRRTFPLDSAATVGADQPVAEFQVRVASSATILISSGDDLSQVDLDELRPGDRVLCFGLIPEVGVFYARTVVIRR